MALQVGTFFYSISYSYMAEFPILTRWQKCGTYDTCKQNGKEVWNIDKDYLLLKDVIHNKVLSMVCYVYTTTFFI